MKVALYQPWIYQRGGMERVVLEMTSSKSKHDWTIFTSHYSPSTTFEDYGKRKVIELDRVPVKRSPAGLIKATLKIAAQKIPGMEEFDVLLVSTAGFGEFITLRNNFLPATCFCHTPLRVIHDSAARKAWLSGKAHFLPLFLAFERAYRLMEKQSWRNFNLIACNSLETKKRILHAGLAGEEKIILAHPGVNVPDFKPSWRYQKYFLAPGRITRLKNLGIVIEAFKSFQKNGGKGFKLVIAGGVGQKDETYLEELKKEALSNPDIIFERDVSEKSLSKLYRDCYCVLFSALNEDWGIVPIEAMAFGKPVISVNEGGPKESVLDGETGFLVNPSTGDFAKAMKRLAKSPALVRKMGREARKHAEKFDWNFFVSAIDDLVEKVYFAGAGK